MKKLIYTLTLLSLPLVAAARDEMVTADDGKNIVSVVQDIKVRKMLEETNEFAGCRKLYEFKAGAGDTERNASLKAAQDCFAKKLGTEKNPEKLKQLSEALNLQQYGLVQSDNVKAIQKYLSDKMYQSLTGANPNETDGKKLAESLKFKNKKHIDQKIFAEMFKTQLGKNALHEVSRFCFENLRLEVHPAGTAPTNFAEYWKDYEPKKTLKFTTSSAVLAAMNDKGNPQFGNISDPTDKAKVFDDIFKSIQGADKEGMDPDKMSEFFMECGQLIVPLCETFQIASKGNLALNESKTDPNSVTTGAAACLAKSRIQDYKLAIKNADAVVKQFRDMGAEDQKSLLIGLDKGQVPKMFGTDANDESIDDLTNNTAAEIFEGGVSEDEKLKAKADKCNAQAELSECEGFISKGDDLEKAKHNIELEMTLKREVEMARVRELVAGDKQKFDEYLEANGYFDIIKAKKDNPSLSNDDVVKMIGASFEAKKIAILEQISNKLGKRQVSEKTKDADALINADAVVKESKEERSRLAQVVLFNNIITSHLTLKKEVSKGKFEDVGRNVNAWKKEEKELGLSQVDPQLFQNLKTNAAGATGVGKDNEIAGFQILDQILGKE